MIQFGLPLDWPAHEDESDFIVTSANANAVRHVNHIGLWPVMATLLTGPRKSGRSFLGRLFAAKTGGMLIDGAENADEETLFHAWNRAQSDRRPLLLIANAPPPTWAIELPDLLSRLRATPHVTIGEPDDSLVAGLIERMMGVRGFAIGPDVVTYLTSRMERSYVVTHRLIDAIDSLATSRRSRVTMTIARDALHSVGVIDDS